MTLRRALDVAANNIANVDTAGFKVEQTMLETDPLAPKAVPGQGPINYVLDTGLARDFRQGALEHTGNTYDVAIDGAGFFTVSTPAGPRYTRDGRFQVDARNRLVDKAGNPVLDASGGEITLDPAKSEPTVGKDGTISQTAQGQTAQVGKLGVVRFANLSALSKQGDNLFDATPDNAPVQARDAVVRQGEVEHSNVQTVLEITNLIEITRAYERVTQMIASNQDLSSRAVDRLGRLN